MTFWSRPRYPWWVAGLAALVGFGLGAAVMFYLEWAIATAVGHCPPVR